MKSTKSPQRNRGVETIGKISTEQRKTWERLQGLALDRAISLLERSDLSFATGREVTDAEQAADIALNIERTILGPRR